MAKAVPGSFANLGFRHWRQPRLDGFRHAFQCLGPRLDDDAVHGKQRDRRRQRLSDMAAAEDVDMRQMRFLSLRGRNQFGSERGIDKPDQDFDAPATALADLRPKRHVECGADFIDLDAGSPPPRGEGGGEAAGWGRCGSARRPSGAF